MSDESKVTTGGQEAQADFATDLIANLESAVFLAYSSEDGALALEKARRDLRQALAVPACTEEDDFITVRDHFAAGALQGALCGAAHHYEIGRWVNLANIDPNGVAAYAYTLADAMLKARAEAR